MQRTITIAGKEYPVKFTLRSIKTYEQVCHRNLLQENYMEVLSLTLGVDPLIAFVYAALVGGLEKGQLLELTLDDLERDLGLGGNYESVVQAYIDFVPGLRSIYNRISNDADFAKKIAEATGNEEALRKLYQDAVSPNGQAQPVMP